MRITEIKSCILGPSISPEQFVAEHMFVFLIKGKMNGYDGKKHLLLLPGECCLVRKNKLSRYNKQKDGTEFEKVVIILDEAFLKDFALKHRVPQSNFSSNEAFLKIKKDPLINSFILSLHAYYDQKGKLPADFSDLKREELMLILLQLHPEYAGILFDFGIPGKIDLETFMNEHYKFNVSLARFAYLTGRSLSAFKRDFKATFNNTPNRWLMQKRLEEAYFLLDKKNARPGDIYLDLGFEDFSHFSFAFKKQFGRTPTQVSERTNKS